MEVRLYRILFIKFTIRLAQMGSEFFIKLESIKLERSDCISIQRITKANIHHVTFWVQKNQPDFIYENMIICSSECSLHSRTGARQEKLQ